MIKMLQYLSFKEFTNQTLGPVLEPYIPLSPTGCHARHNLNSHLRSFHARTGLILDPFLLVSSSTPAKRQARFRQLLATRGIPIFAVTKLYINHQGDVSSSGVRSVDSELSVDDTMKLMIGYGGGVAQNGPTSCIILPIPMCSDELCLMLA